MAARGCLAICAWLSADAAALKTALTISKLNLSLESACIILEAHGDHEERTYDARFLEQYRLGTSYPSIVQAVGTLLDREPMAGDCTLAIDHTGVGRPVFDMFRAENRQPIGITITGGVGWHVDPNDHNQWHVAKIQLVSMVQRFLQSGRLRIGAKLPHAGTLQAELRNFRVKISKAANETYDAREGSHDDLVLSLAIALFVGEHSSPGIDISPDEIRRIQKNAGILPGMKPPAHTFQVGDQIKDRVSTRGKGVITALGVAEWVLVRWENGEGDWVFHLDVSRV